MHTNSFRLSLALILLFRLTAVAQNAVPTTAQSVDAAAKPKAAKTDLTKEAIIIESLRIASRYESDGTGAKTSYARMRVQSESGVQQAGTIRFGYNTAFERIDIDYVRVTKPDGSKITATTDSIQDVPSEIQRIAPQYTDFREKIISVPGLRPGDLLEYAAKTTIHSPLIPGHFFDEHTFAKKGVVLEERFELDVPADGKLKTKFEPKFTPSVQTEGQRKKYVWTSSIQDTDYSSVPDEDEPSPDIQFSTFQDSSEIATWYAGLQSPRAIPDDQVRKKAEELTATAKSQEEKVRAIYNYVSTSVRYLGLSFGVGRYQPHAAYEVLLNQYGDCKDKHTLLTALLAAIGVKAEAVLIHTGRKLDSAVPSPLQFNHLITAIPLQSGYVYADTTTEVAPLGALLKPLRGKQALRIGPAGEASIVTTPADALQLSREISHIDAKINEDGDLQGKVTLSAQGDAEVVWRLLLRRTPESQWPLLFKGTLASLGLEADVSNVTSSDPSALDKPFELKFELAKKKYASIPSGGKMKLPITDLAIRPAATPAQKKGPIRLGAQEVSNQLRLELPKGFTITPPRNVKSAQDFAEYESRYRIEKNIAYVDRSYRIKVDEVPRARFQDYNKVYDEITADQADTAYLYQRQLDWRRPAAKTKSAAQPDNRSAADLIAEAESARRLGKISEAETLLKKATTKYPDNPEVWAMLGSLYLRQQFIDKAMPALRKVVELDPKYPNAWQTLGFAYMQLGKVSEEADAFARQLEITPDAPGLNSMLGFSLVQANRPQEAIEPLKKAMAENPPETLLSITLAKAYFLSGQKENGLQQVQALLGDDPPPLERAEIADMLAETRQAPDLAEQQAQLALSAAYEKLQHAADLKLADASDLQRAWKLAGIWRAVGWVYFQKGEVSRAQRYLEAAWAWSQQLGPGDRLAQLYMKQGQSEEAVRVWAQAFSGAAFRFLSDAWERFVAAAGDEKNANALMAQRRLDLQELRTVQVPNPKRLSGSGEFYLSVGSNSRIEAAHQHEGDTRLSPMSEALLKLRLELPFPDEQQIHVLRAGILSCYSSSPTCMLVLLPAGSAQMLSPGF